MSPIFSVIDELLTENSSGGGKVTRQKPEDPGTWNHVGQIRVQYAGRLSPAQQASGKGEYGCTETKLGKRLVIQQVEVDGMPSHRQVEDECCDRQWTVSPGICLIWGLRITPSETQQEGAGQPRAGGFCPGAG